MNILKELGKSSLIYGIGGAISKGIPFFLLPVYTRIFSPLEYGQIEMMTVLCSLIVAFLVMGLDSAQSYYFFEQKNKGIKEQKKIISSVLQWRFFSGSLIIILATLISPFLNYWLFDNQLTLVHFIVAFSGAFFITMMGHSIEIFRLTFRPIPYILVSILNSFLAAIIILGLIIIFEYGIIGYFFGTTIAGFVTACLGWFLVREFIDFKKIHFKWLPELLKFGLPLLPLGLSLYVLNVMDRWFIQFYHGGEVLGIYAVAAQIALIMSILIETFRKAWWPISMDAMHGKNGEEVFKSIARFYMGVVCAGVLTMTFLISFIIELMTIPAYYSASDIAIILIWPPIFYGFYMIVSAGLWKNKKTTLMLCLFLISSVVNLILNQILVPLYSGQGAAFATLISFIVLIILCIYFSEKNWYVGFELTVYLCQIFVTVFAIINHLFFEFVPWLINYILTIVVLIFITLRKEERKKIVNYFS